VSTVFVSLALACGVRAPAPPFPHLVPESSPFSVFASSIVPPIPEAQSRRFGGLSGLAYDRSANEWVAVSDDSVTPRWFVCRIVASRGRVQIRQRRVVFARSATDAPGAPRVLDFEAVVVLPGGDLLIASEGSVEGGRHHPDSLLRFQRDGSYKSAVSLPEKFLPAEAGAPPRGLRENRGFEGLAISTDATRLWAIAEAPLIQDDELPSAQRGARTRLLEFEIDGDALRHVRELVYPIDQVQIPDGLGATPQVVDQGVSDMTMLPDGSLLTLERAFVRGSGTRRTVNVIKLFRVRLDGADDVSAVQSLRAAPDAHQVNKQLLLDLSSVASSLPPRLSRLDNFEAMAPGPAVAGGPSLMLLSDDNFSALQITAAVLLRY
jgi:hypothetical protein